MYIYIYIYMISLSISLSIYVYMCIYIYIYDTCVYIYIYIYIYIYREASWDERATAVFVLNNCHDVGLSVHALPHFPMEVDYDYGKMRHFCDDPVCLDPVRKLSKLGGQVGSCQVCKAGSCQGLGGLLGWELSLSPQRGIRKTTGMVTVTACGRAVGYDCAF